MDYAKAGLLGAGLLGKLISSSGSGSGTPTGAAYNPFVQPITSNKDYRANPTIANYETYGFGPEASFFTPEYSQIISGALAPKTTTSATTYKPLING